MKRSIITTLVALATFLFVGVSTPSVRATPTDPIPATITATTTNLLFYFWGVLDGVEAAENLPLAGPISLREAARQSRLLAILFNLSSSPQTFSYFWGRADGLDRAADAAGEPR